MAVSAPANPQQITFEDYLQMPEMRLRYDIIDGELIMSPAPSFEHQWDLADLSKLMRDFVRKQDIGVVLFAPLDVGPQDSALDHPPARHRLFQLDCDWRPDPPGRQGRSTGKY